MKRILGPEYRYSGEQLAPGEIVYIDDHHYDAEQGIFPVEDLLANNPGDRLLVFDHLAHDDRLKDFQHVCLPVFLANEAREFVEQKIQPNWQEKTHIFNFMINKPRPNRLYLLELVDQLKINNYLHTLAWQSSPISTVPVTDLRFGPEIRLDRGVKNGSFRNAYTYDHLLKRQIFEPTCISLITEPCYYERESMITEKTLMAFYAGTLPIWVGGWKLPDVLRDIGFDVFDDIVDHSYSTLEDPRQRLEQAFIKNINLLKDFNRVHEFIKSHTQRLQHNVDLVEKNVFLDLVQMQIIQRPELLSIAKLWNLVI